VCLHPSVSLNNEKICCEISEDKIAVCEKTAGLQCGKFSDLNSACWKVLVPIKIFQFQDMLNENRFLGTFRGHSKRPIGNTLLIGIDLTVYSLFTQWPRFRVKYLYSCFVLSRVENYFVIEPKNSKKQIRPGKHGNIIFICP
jgi:hypothetical protein